PVGPTSPCAPVSPFEPSAPAGPAVPVAPVSPLVPSAPAGPAGPVLPVSPFGPSAPVGPAGPALPVGPEGPARPAGPSTLHETGVSLDLHALVAVTIRNDPFDGCSQALIAPVVLELPIAPNAKLAPPAAVTTSARTSSSLPLPRKGLGICSL